MSKSIAAVLLVVLAPSLALAHGNKGAMTKDAIGAALDAFKKDDPARAHEFVGVKGWIDGEKISVKIYVANNAAVIYACSEMEMTSGGDMFACEKAQ